MADDSLDDETRDQGKCDLIEELILKYDWKSVLIVMIAVLEDNNRRYDDYVTSAEVIWGAALDEKHMPVNRIIALLYHRLEPDKDSDENNLAWSIVCKLKGVDYLSEHDPLEDPGIKREMEKIKTA
ncbi:hypothetical protein ACFL4N_05115 [Thermodesulfobacteriota bacterium]